MEPEDWHLFHRLYRQSGFGHTSGLSLHRGITSESIPRSDAERPLSEACSDGRARHRSSPLRHGHSWRTRVKIAQLRIAWAHTQEISGRSVLKVKWWASQPLRNIECRACARLLQFRETIFIAYPMKTPSPASPQ